MPQRSANGAEVPSSRGPRRYRSLTSGDIADAALDVVVRDGFDRLTMRSVAAQLQHPVMNLYHYVDGKDALLDLVLERVLESVETSEASGDWRADVTSTLDQLRTALTLYPGAARILASRPSAGPHALRIAEALLASLSQGGLDGRRLVAAYTMLRDLVLGLALQGDVWRSTAAQTTDLEALGDHLQTRLAGLPHVAANLSLLLQRDHEEQFRFVVATTLTGLELGAAAARDG